MKKALIITYYWPPKGGAGVQRWLKFAKYFRDFGWDPIIYTPEGGKVPVYDYSLLEEIPEGIQIIKRPIWEPYLWYEKLFHKGKEGGVYDIQFSEQSQSTWKGKIVNWIRSNLFIPDARKFWIGPSVKFLNNYLSENKIDVLISTGPPHSMHLIAYRIAQKRKLPWLADFRDPWTQIDYYHQLLLTKWADRRHRQLEHKVLTTAERVVTVSWGWARELERLGAGHVDVITNGYDEADFQIGDCKNFEYFRLTHIGSLNKDRNPNQLWNALQELVGENSILKGILKIQLIGPVDEEALRSIRYFGLQENLEHVNYVDHNRIGEYICGSHLLLLLINNTPNVQGIIPGKLFEYLYSKRPILCVGDPKGDSGKILNETGAGVTVHFKDKEKMKEVIAKHYQYFIDRQFVSVESGQLEKYSRKVLTQKMVKILNGMI
ncbi:MAG: glycosyltransferase family 4 protein [Chlorobi bacterium]|nr:glycosyltransferase family 4 protein [Chlorobiota bacterium]